MRRLRLPLGQRGLIAVAALRGFPLSEFDVSQAFIQAPLSGLTVLIRPPMDKAASGYWRFDKNMYGRRNAPHHGTSAFVMQRKRRDGFLWHLTLVCLSGGVPWIICRVAVFLPFMLMMVWLLVWVLLRVYV